jgi:hypothetical protein
MKQDRTRLPRFVIAAIRDVEEADLTDMDDRETVLMFAAVLDHGDAAEWLSERRHLYPRALFTARAETAVPVSRAG